jgi:hypothetical protein
MITIKNSGIFFCYISLFILLSCSKSDTSNPFSGAILNSFTYTVTDTTGINHMYSDTAKLNPNGTYSWLINGMYLIEQPFAYIWQIDPGNKNPLAFEFVDAKSHGENVLHFSLPYFQASLSGTTNDFPVSPIFLRLEGIDYHLAPPEPPGGSQAYLAVFMVSTNISDSTAGYVTGSLNFSARTKDSGKIQINGKFSNMTTNFKP